MLSKQMLIEEINKKESGTKRDSSKLLEYEIQIKELTNSENKELKIKLKEKEELLQKYEKNYKDISEQIKVIEQKSSGFTIEELVKKDNIIKSYEAKLEENEMKYKEEINMVSTALYEVAFNFLVKDIKDGKDLKEGKDGREHEKIII